MLAVPSRFRTHNLQPDDGRRPRLSLLLSSKPLRNALLSALTLIVLICLFTITTYDRHDLPFTARTQLANDESQPPADKARFHLLVPATSSNADLCKLLLSAQILGYPPPVLINFGHPEDADSYVQHMGKVQGILDYLEALEPAGNNQSFQEDLVLIVDGYDVWFQLRLEVLLTRYYGVIEAADNRTRNVYGEELFREKDMRQTIVFGPDKMCWPRDVNRPACWAVPETTLTEYAFGPQTGAGQEEHDQPRWLNSGTIIGPASDLRAFFGATLDEISRNYTVDSDQFYMAELFGRQEWARLQHKPELLEHMKSIRFGPEHDLPDDWETPREDPFTDVERTEYHIGIDYESAMFQTMAFYKPWLTWARASDGWEPDNEYAVAGHKQYSVPMPEDVLKSDRPFSALQHVESPIGVNVDAQQPWTDVRLLYNTVTHQIPAIFHIAGGPVEKPFRQYWWHNLWFQAYGEQLRLAALQEQYLAQQLAQQQVYAAPLKKRRRMRPEEKVIGGYVWSNAEPVEADEVRMRGLGGAWADMAGGWFSWRGLCGDYERGLYGSRGQNASSRPELRPREAAAKQIPDEPT